jgi:putative peptidoglycan lipid II flippase
MLIKVLAPHYFAHQDTKTPVKIGVIAMLANMAFNLAFVWSLGHTGLALATSIAAWVNALLLLAGLHRRGWYRVVGFPIAASLKVALGLIVMTQMMWLMPWAVDLSQMDVMARLMWTLLILGGAGLLYLGTLLTLGIRYTQLLVPPSAR